MPYQSIGKLLAYFEQSPTLQGTAFYIGTNLLLTVAHNIYNKKNQMAIKVIFYPAQRKDQSLAIKAKNWRKLEGYKVNQNLIGSIFGPNIYDWALI